MPQKSPIEWTDYTSNPFRARDRATNRVGWHCVKVSPGCANCYSEKIDGRFGLRRPYQRGETSNVEVFVNDAEIAGLLRLRGAHKIFLCDMTDIFLEAVTDAMLDRVFAAAAISHEHSLQVLTKRAERAREYLSDSNTPLRIADQVNALRPVLDGIRKDWSLVSPIAHELGRGEHWPLPNVWVGFSAEDQKRFDERSPHFGRLAHAGWLTWCSAEPLLGSIDMTRVPNGGGETYNALTAEATTHRGHTFRAPDSGPLAWIVAGGESGPGARPMHPDWARGVRDQCVEAGVAFHFKQWGEWLPISQWDDDDFDGRIMTLRHDGAIFEADEPTTFCCAKCTEEDILRMGKKAAGRLLDGRTWDEFPRATGLAHA